MAIGLSDRASGLFNNCKNLLFLVVLCSEVKKLIFPRKVVSIFLNAIWRAIISERMIKNSIMVHDQNKIEFSLSLRVIHWPKKKHVMIIFQNLSLSKTFPSVNNLLDFTRRELIIIAYFYKRQYVNTVLQTSKVTDQSYRFGVDYRKVNTMSRKDNEKVTGFKVNWKLTIRLTKIYSIVTEKLT